MEEKDNEMPKLKLERDIVGLSLVEIITLQRLMGHPRPVVRFILYHEINQFFSLNYTPEKNAPATLSTSSFYNSLRKLEENGLVTSVKMKMKENDNVHAVRATEKAKSTISAIIGHLIANYVDDVNYVLGILAGIMKKLGISSVQATLIVNMSEDIDRRLLDTAFSLSDEIFLLARKDIYEGIVKQGFAEVKSSTIYNNVIREPNDMFDAAIVPGYEKNPDFFGLSRRTVLEELVRVVKSGGFLATMVRSKLPKIDNFYGNELLGKYEDSISGQTFTEAELREDFEGLNLSKFEILDFQGTIIGLGWIE